MNKFYLYSFVFTSLLASIGCLEPRIAFFSLTKVPHVFDADEKNVPIQRIAEELCASKSGATKEQISRVSTVIRLHEFFANQADGAKLIDCAERYGRVLASLKNVLESHNENVCSDEKIYLIEDFHRDYVSKNNDDIKQRDADAQQAAPEVLKLFFMHYAMEVSAICKRSLITNLEWDLSDKIEEDEFDLGSETLLNKLMDRMSTSFSPVRGVNDYDDVLLIWDLIKDDGNEEIDELTGEPVKLLIKSKEVEGIQKVQERCRCKFRPLYEKLILPIINLVDIGYSYTGERFEKELNELKTNKLVSRWYGITQVCEAILPIKFYQDDTLNEQDLVIISREEAELIESKQGAGKGDLRTLCSSGYLHGYEPTTNSMVGIDKLDSVETVEAQELVQDISLKTSGRERAIKRAYKRLLKNLKEKKSKSLYFSHKKRKTGTGRAAETDQSEKISTDSNGEDEFVKEELQEKLSDQLKDLSDEDVLAMEGAFGHRKSKIIKRNKQRPRSGDMNLLHVQKQEALSYQHTRSLSEIINNFLDQLAPRKRTIILFGTIMIAILVVVLIIT